MKYYVGNIDERNGEYEYCTTIRFAIESDPKDFLIDVASTWYGDDNEPEELIDGEYQFNGGEVCVSNGEWKEINKATFEELSILSDLSHRANKEVK